MSRSSRAEDGCWLLTAGCGGLAALECSWQSLRWPRRVVGGDHWWCVESDKRCRERERPCLLVCVAGQLSCYRTPAMPRIQKTHRGPTQRAISRTQLLTLAHILQVNLQPCTVSQVDVRSWSCAVSWPIHSVESQVASLLVARVVNRASGVGESGREPTDASVRHTHADESRQRLGAW